MSTGDAVLAILLTFCVALIIGGIIFTTYQDNKCCKLAGYAGYSQVGDIPACADEQGNLHYVQMPGGFRIVPAKNISVGDVRVVPTQRG